jgi:hypothetical protein
MSMYLLEFPEIFKMFPNNLAERQNVRVLQIIGQSKYPRHRNLGRKRNLIPTSAQLIPICFFVKIEVQSGYFSNFVAFRFPAIVKCGQIAIALKFSLLRSLWLFDLVH